jgi:Na+-transporting methylmalonyl-CoA/oxaloacetate decarboxylase gamma subunit
VDEVQAILGEVLLVIAGLAVVLLALILVLAEIELIVRLSRKLVRRRTAGEQEGK